MNQSSMPFVDSNNPWAEPSSLPPVKKSFTAVTALAFFLCSCCLALCCYEWGVVLLLVSLFAYVVYAAHSPKVAAWVLSGAVLITTLTATLAVGAIFLAMAVGCMSGAFLLTTVKRIPMATVLVIPLAAVALSFALTQSPALSLLSVAFVPAAILLALATRLHHARTSALCFAIGGFLLTAVIAVLVLVYKATGSLNRSALQSFAELCRNGLFDYLVGIRTELLSLLSEADSGEEMQKMYNELSTTLSDEAIRGAISSLFNLLPALITVAASIIAFLSQILLLAAYHTAGLEKVLTPKARMLTVSATAAIIYLVCFLLMFFLPNGMALAVVQNIALILSPILLLVGVQTLLGMIAKAKGGMKIFLILAIVAMLCCYSGGVFLLLAAWGAYSRIAALIQQKIYEKMGQRPNGPSDPDQ